MLGTDLDALVQQTLQSEEMGTAVVAVVHERRGVVISERQVAKPASRLSVGQRKPHAVTAVDGALSSAAVRPAVARGLRREVALGRRAAPAAAMEDAQAAGLPAAPRTTRAMLACPHA